MIRSFAKMHGLGNDFMLVDAISHPMDSTLLPVAALSNRFMGVGFDQLLVIKPSKKADFFCRIYNSDGSEAEQCGNGLRCIARYIIENKLTIKTAFTIETVAGIYPAEVAEDTVTIKMGAPTIIENSINLQLPNNDFVNDVTALSVGNPHAVIRVEDVASIDVGTIGAQISQHVEFPAGTNVGFMEVVSPSHIKLRTYERGAAETHACGSNACAAVVTGITRGWLDKTVDVEFRFGTLTISWNGKGQPIQMSGPAVYVFNGELKLDA